MAKMASPSDSQSKSEHLDHLREIYAVWCGSVDPIAGWGGLKVVSMATLASLSATSRFKLVPVLVLPFGS
jgi:hypothetical protein